MNSTSAIKHAPGRAVQANSHRPPSSNVQSTSVTSPGASVQRDSSQRQSPATPNASVEVPQPTQPVRKSYQRKSSEMLTYVLFLISFFLSLSLFSAGQASGRISIDPTDPSPPAGTLGFWTFLGFLGLVYSMAGICMNCTGRLPFKYIKCWLATTGLSMLYYALLWIYDSPPKSPLHTD